MINWIIGGIIAGLTIFIIVRSVVKLRKGKGCCCENCSQSQCSSRKQN